MGVGVCHLLEPTHTSKMHINEVMINLPLKEMDGTLLALTILNVTDSVRHDDVKEAIELAAFFHRGATRANRGIMPRDHYVTHPLRNTLRLIRWGVNDIDSLIASLLHDTVEDCSDEMLSLSNPTLYPEERLRELTEDEKASLVLELVKARFGERVGVILKGVTNPSFDDGLTREEKHDLYRAHVINAVKADEGVLLVKLADFIDNAGSIHYNLSTSQSMVAKLAKKYSPLVEPLLKEAENIKLLPESSVNAVLDQLAKVKERLAELS